MKLTALTPTLTEAAEGYPTAESLGVVDPKLPRMSQWFDNGVATLVKAKEDGQIIKSAYADAVSAINRGLEKPADELYFTKFLGSVRQRITDPNANIWNEMSPEERALGDLSPTRPTLHNIPGLLKKLNAIKAKHPVTVEFIKLFTAMLPLVELAKEVKGLQVSARDLQAKAREEAGIKQKERTHILHQHENVQKMNKVLREISDQYRVELEEQLLDEYKYIVKQVEAALDNLEARIASKEVKTKYGSVRLVDIFDERHAAQLRLANSITDNKEFSYNKYMPVMKPAAEVQKIIEIKSKKDAEEIMGMFLARGSNKLSEILAATGPTTEISLYDVNLHRGVMEAIIHVQYENGSRFSLKQQIVWVVNSHGTYFYRYPATFHNVVITKDGKQVPMKGANEATMNKEFVQYNPATPAENTAL